MQLNTNKPGKSFCNRLKIILKVLCLWATWGLSLNVVYWERNIFSKFKKDPNIKNRDDIKIIDTDERRSKEFFFKKTVPDFHNVTLAKFGYLWCLCFQGCKFWKPLVNKKLRKVWATKWNK